MNSQDSRGNPTNYDVFISYNPTDSAWVWDWIVPKLKQAGLQVAIDEESFQPGAPVLEEIERCISASRKTIIVLSPDWVGDQSKIFESLLVQQKDPGARVRQMIPILVKPCTPPQRIQLLQWVDFTDTDRNEQQLRRVVTAIQGAAELPELHPERALPDAIQRTWELRWLWVVGLVAIVTLALLGSWIWSQRPSDQMDPEKYGIAVAEFTVLDENKAPIDSDLGAQMASRIAGFIATEAAELGEVMRSPVQVWGDSPEVEAVAESTQAKRAKDIEADVLIYGSILQKGDGWEAAPEFYLDEKAVSNNASELIGEYALGTPIPFITNDRASEGNLTTTMRARTRALTQLLMGLSHYASGTTDSYRQAADIFQTVAQDAEWGAAAAKSGQEVLYLFLGNALLKLGSLSDDSEQRSQYLQRSEEAYQKALEYNPEYARVFNGLGSLNMQQALSIDTNDECLQWHDWDLLEKAATAYARALAMPEATKPVAGQVDLRAHLGLGRIRYYQGLCLSTDIEPAAWEDAVLHHNAVLDDYEKKPLEHTRLLATVSHLDLADIAAQEAGWRLDENSADSLVPPLLADATTHYRSALALLTAPLTEEELRLAITIEGKLLTVICWQGDTATAEESLTSFLNRNNVSTEMEQVLYAIVQEECEDAR